MFGLFDILIVHWPYSRWKHKCPVGATLIRCLGHQPFTPSCWWFIGIGGDIPPRPLRIPFLRLYRVGVPMWCPHPPLPTPPPCLIYRGVHLKVIPMANHHSASIRAQSSFTSRMFLRICFPLRFCTRTPAFSGRLYAPLRA